MYGVITTVPAPVEMYDAVHAEMLRRAGTSVDGLLVHVGRATADGFQTLEVWESEEHYDRANSAIVFRCCGSWLAISLYHRWTRQQKPSRCTAWLSPAATSSSSRLRHVSQPGEALDP
jgi:hypothetical protein